MKKMLFYILILPLMVVSTLVSGVLLITSYIIQYIFDKVEFLACCIYGFALWLKGKILFNDKHDLITVIYYVYNQHNDMR